MTNQKSKLTVLATAIVLVGLTALVTSTGKYFRESDRN